MIKTHDRVGIVEGALEGTRRDLEIARLERRKISEEMEALRGENELLRAQNAALKENYTQLQAEYERLKVAYEMERRENRELYARIRNLEKKINGN